MTHVLKGGKSRYGQLTLQGNWFEDRCASVMQSDRHMVKPSGNGGFSTTGADVGLFAKDKIEEVLRLQQGGQWFTSGENNPKHFNTQTRDDFQAPKDQIPHAKNPFDRLDPAWVEEYRNEWSRTSSGVWPKDYSEAYKNLKQIK